MLKAHSQETTLNSTNYLIFQMDSFANKDKQSCDKCACVMCHHHDQMLIHAYEKLLNVEWK